MNSFDIIILAGQSNAEGSGLGRVYKNFHSDGQIFELIDANRSQVTLNEQGHLALIKPYTYRIQEAQESIQNGAKYGNLAHSFAENYIQAGRLAPGQKVLIVKAAIGGTGFTKNHWGKDNDLPLRMFDMVSYAFSQSENSRVVAVLWHQGEHDVFENSEISLELRYKYYLEKFGCLVRSIQEKYGNIPIIAGGFTDEWRKDYIAQCEAIMKATKKVLSQSNGKFVSSRGLQSNNQNLHNGDTIHFCRSALYAFGKRYYKAFEFLANQK